MVNVFYILVSLLFTSCGLLETKPSLKTQSVEEVLTSVRAIGEGRGRLTLSKQQYVFGYDSILKEDFDWVLAVAIPLQGEEYMILPDLRKVGGTNRKLESFERRIDGELRGRLADKRITGQRFIAELRSLVRFILAPQIGLTRTCSSDAEMNLCRLADEQFQVILSDKQIAIKKQGHLLELVAENLTDSFFAKTSFHLRLPSEGPSAHENVSLELFWK